MRKFAVLVTLLVVADQASKVFMDTWLFLGQSVPVIPGFFQWTLVYNPGAAFGLLGGLDASLRIGFFVVVGCVALAVCVYLYRHGSTWFHRQGALLIAAGAIGNMIDRVRLGYVIDFFDVFLGSYHWPAFNVADIGITVGAACYAVALTMEFRAEQQRKSSKAKESL